MKKLLFAILFVLTAISAVAQPIAAPTSRFQWTYDASSLGVAQAMRYEVGIDAEPGVTTLVHTCLGTVSPFTCTAPIPAVTPTTHTARVRVVDARTTTPLVGPWSDPVTFTMTAVPGQVRNLVVISGGN